MNQQERKRSFRAFSILITITVSTQLMLAPAGLAQTDRGRITGIVRDQAKAVIAGATVNIKNERSGEVRTATTNDQGSYTVANLRASVYTIRASAQGFGETQIDGLELLVGQTVTRTSK